MSASDRTPIIIGVGQVEQRADDPATAREPLELMVEAAQEAGVDCGDPTILRKVDSVRVVRGIWGYANPARRVAQRIGAADAQSAMTSLGGNYVQVLTGRSFRDIRSGDNEIVLVAGGECGRTQARARKAGVDLAWNPLPTAPGANPTLRDDGSGAPDLFIGSHKVTRHAAELARGIRLPVQFYPMFEIALRHHNGESVDEHLARISKLWAGFSEVATRNPHAWIRKAISAEEIRTPSPANRAVSFPYTKLMNSNNSVDQGAALLLTSVGRARALGIAEDRWVYPHAGTEAWDHLYVSERDTLHTSPAIRLCAARLLEMLDATPESLDHVDLYSCFPAAVQIAAREIGVSLQRPLTVTGGLTFGGGPLNNYVMHAVARMVEALRASPGSRGLVTANGGLLTKHALCAYSTEPPQTPFQWADLQARSDAMPRRRVTVNHTGGVDIETYVVMFENDAPHLAHVACLLPDGSRTWANVSDADTVGAMTREEFCGRPGRVDGRGGLRVMG